MLTIIGANVAWNCSRVSNEWALTCCRRYQFSRNSPDLAGITQVLNRLGRGAVQFSSC
jgi:hypothetical protein